MFITLITKLKSLLSGCCVIFNRFALHLWVVFYFFFSCNWAVKISSNYWLEIVTYFSTRCWVPSILYCFWFHPPTDSVETNQSVEGLILFFWAFYYSTCFYCLFEQNYSSGNQPKLLNVLLHFFLKEDIQTNVCVYCCKKIIVLTCFQ